jgi:esterase FrsA
VDTWKVELHAIAANTASMMHARVLTLDMPGTGESPVANGPDGDHYLSATIDWVRQRHPSPVIGAVGFSFGGHWTAKLALTKKVDAAIDIGGPVDATFEPQQVANMKYGMAGIFGNSLRLDAAPTQAELADVMSEFSFQKQGLLDDWGPDPVPLLVVNGADDPHVPQRDSTLFESRPETVVHLVGEATHCAGEKLGEVIPSSLRWLAGVLQKATANAAD